MSQERVIEGRSFRIEVTDRDLVATLLVPKDAQAQASEVLAKIRETGIVAPVDEHAITATLKQPTTAEVAIVVARGTPPVDDRLGKLEFRVPPGDPETGILTRLFAGQEIAVFGQGSEGSDGRDIFGIAVPRSRPAGPSLGAGVELKKGAVIATVAGTLDVSPDSICVRPLHEVHADADAKRARPGPIEGDAIVKGTLREGRPLRVAGRLVVHGAVEATPFRAGSWAHVKGGIIARKRFTAMVRGGLWCRYATGAHLIAGGDVHVQGELLNCRLACAGRLVMPRGSIVGGETFANGGVACETLGNSAWIPTLVEAGVDRATSEEAAESQPEIEANRRRAAEIQQKIGPLTQQLKNLTPQQRERATELMYDANELQLASEQTVRDLEVRAEAAKSMGKSEILVSGVLYPGVTVRFPGVQAVVRTELRGPLRLTSRGAGAEIEVIAVEDGGAVCPLPSTRYREPSEAEPAPEKATEPIAKIEQPKLRAAA